jgi:hypothetical protein
MHHLRGVEKVWRTICSAVIYDLEYGNKFSYKAAKFS